MIDSLMNSGELATAVAEARKWVRVYHEDPQWQPVFTNRLAVGLLRLGQPQAALPLLEELVLQNPGQPLGHRNLASCLQALGRRGRAMSEFQQVVELDPGNALAHLEYGQMLLGYDILPDAGREILTAAHLCGDCDQVQPALAEYFLKSHEFEKAVEPCRRLWSLAKDENNRRNLLQALIGSGRLAEAKDLIIAGPLSPLPRDELEQLAVLEGKLGCSDQSRKFVEWLASTGLEPQVPGSVREDPAFWGRVSLNLQADGQDSLALVAVDRAIVLEPDSVVYRNNRVVLLQEMGRLDEAKREWDQVRALDPSLDKGSQ